MELEAIPQPERDWIERVGGADLVIGVLDVEEGSSAVAMTREAAAMLSMPLKAMVVCNNGSGNVSNNGSNSGARDPTAPAPEAAENNQSTVFSCSLPLPGQAETPQQRISNAYDSVFAISGRLGVRACGLIASGPQAVTPQWIFRLVQPVVDLGFDLVGPCYTRQKMEGFLNRSVLSPLHRALYGEQLQNPVGPDFGLSGKLVQQILRQDSARRRGVAGNTLASIASTAACGGLQVCEAHLGVRTQGPIDWGNLSSLLAEILGAMFLEMESRAPYWQSIRGSKTVPVFGLSEAPVPETAAVDVPGMIESFQLGAKNLQDVWGLILPPTTLMELRRLSRAPQDQFRMSDPLWSRIVYDFALGHRLRTISRDHLLRSITPLYLGWIASYALEMQTAGPTEVDSRIERLAKAYEDGKSYLVSRWRWPDRFNP